MAIVSRLLLDNKGANTAEVVQLKTPAEIDQSSTADCCVANLSVHAEAAALLPVPFFFFRYVVGRRDLHSFPTRRSSDLDREISRRRHVIGIGRLITRRRHVRIGHRRRIDLRRVQIGRPPVRTPLPDGYRQPTAPRQQRSQHRRGRTAKDASRDRPILHRRLLRRESLRSRRGCRSPSSAFFFFPICRRTPRSTLFPYTTLFRS